MTIVAALTIEAGTDTLIRSEGFDPSSFTVISAGAAWRILLEPAIAASAPLDRQPVGTSNTTTNLRIQASNVDASPGIPAGRILVFSLDYVTGVFTPVPPPLDQIYVTIQRIFKEAQP